MIQSLLTNWILQSTKEILTSILNAAVFVAAVSIEYRQLALARSLSGTLFLGASIFHKIQLLHRLFSKKAFYHWQSF